MKIKPIKIKEPIRTIPLLPSLITLTNLFFGFMSILFTFYGRYRMAALWIIIAAIMDGLDGLVARVIKASSDFGIELDSLCDSVSFGLATSILLYFWGLKDAGAAGVFLSFVFLTAALLRLARYNIKTRVQIDRRYYQGLTVPSAALFMSSIINFHKEPLSSHSESLLLAGLIIVVSFCMISTLPYRNFVKFLAGRRIDVKLLFLVAVVLAVVIFKTKLALMIIFGLNVLSGPLSAAFKLLKKRVQKQPSPRETEL